MVTAEWEKSSTLSCIVKEGCKLADIFQPQEVATLASGTTEQHSEEWVLTPTLHAVLIIHPRISSCFKKLHILYGKAQSLKHF